MTSLWTKSHPFGTKDIAGRASWDVALLAPSGDSPRTWRIRLSGPDG